MINFICVAPFMQEMQLSVKQVYFLHVVFCELTF